MEQGLNRKNHLDITGQIFVADPRAVSRAVCEILEARYPGLDTRPVRQSFDAFARLYTGDLPGYLGCDTWYHDAQHSLDNTLVMARLIDGHENDVAPSEQLGERRAVLGVISALFHDAGYIRRESESDHHGAEFTLSHVQRSGEFLAEFLPTVGFSDEAEMARELVHFTGYEVALDKIRVEHPLDRRLGFLLGTADLLAQMSDRCYLEKCHDCLYPEFEICGLGGAPRDDGTQPIYASPEELVRKSPQFMDDIWRDRLDGYFEGVYRHAVGHFGSGDENPYVEAIRKRRERIDQTAATGNISASLRRQVDCINAGPLRIILGQSEYDPQVFEAARPPRSRAEPG